MLRKLHTLPALVVSVLVMVLAVTGAIMSLHPALEHHQAVLPDDGQLSVARAAQNIVAQYPGTDQIKRTASGSTIVYFTRNGQPDAVLVNPVTGDGIEPYRPSAFFRWVKDLHRSFLSGDAGRGVAGLSAAVLVFLCLSGVWLLVRRMGGWRNLMQPIRGSAGQRLHSQLGRVAVLTLLLSAVTGGYMSAVRFGLLPDASLSEPPFPSRVSDGNRAPVGDLAALQRMDFNQLQDLVFPYPDDPQDVYSITTSAGTGYVDPVTGALMRFEERPLPSSVYALIYRLHTGEGLWWLGLLLGFGALTVPVLSVTGTFTWWRRRRARPKRPNSTAAREADTVILVGSQGNTTWGFAGTLQASLAQAGYRVHLSTMNGLQPDYPNAQRLFLLTATYGDGDAPDSASEFLKRLDKVPEHRRLPYAVLGFGDRQFPNFCQYARTVDDALSSKGWPRLMAPEWIDRQNSQAFSRWGSRLGLALGIGLELTHTAVRPPTRPMTLIEREDYGEDSDAPISVLRFRPSDRTTPSGDRSRSGTFEAGDLMGIVPPGSELPRYYSLASSTEDGVAEICVRKHAHGLCSGYLLQLAVGDTVEIFIQHNPQFRPATGKSPVVLIGAGTGIGPLAGFIRRNRSRQPMYLYWGGRNPQSDFLYRDALHDYLADRRLHALNTAFSRTQQACYVQDKLHADASRLRDLMTSGGQILVCGGRDMASGVMEALDDILAPLDVDVRTLKAQGRYLEDVY